MSAATSGSLYYYCNISKWGIGAEKLAREQFRSLARLGGWFLDQVRGAAPGEGCICEHCRSSVSMTYSDDPRNFSLERNAVRI